MANKDNNMSDVASNGTGRIIPFDLSSFLAAYGSFLVLAGLNILIYARILAFSLTGLDDTTLIAGGGAYALSYKSMLRLFSTVLAPECFQYFYRPLLMISFIVDAHLHPYIPFIFHATNIVIHVAASSLLFVFLRKLDYRPATSLFFAALFAAHPVLTPAVAWIPGRNDSLLGLFVLASFVAYINYLQSRNVRHYALHMFAFAGALFVKESGIAMLALLPVYPRLVQRRQSAARRDYACYAGWMLIVAGWASLKMYAAGAKTPVMPAVFVSLLAALPSLPQYLGKAIFPLQLSNLATQKDTPWFYGIAACLLVALGLIFSKGRRNGRVIFGTMWFVLFLAPTLMFQNDFKLEHRLYVPIVGLFLVLSETGIPSVISVRWQKALQILAIAVFGVLAFNYADVFSGPLVFWTNAARTSPRNPWVHSGLGRTYAEMRLGAPALREFERAYELEPKHTPNSSIFAFDLGSIYMDAGKLPEAENVFKNAIAAGSGNFSKIYFLYGSLCRRQNRLPEAEQFYKQALRINPRYIDYYKGLIELYEVQGREKKSAVYRGMIQRLAKDDGASLMYIDAASARWLSGIMNNETRNACRRGAD
jgi:tetratricopeptide (TPR) repeat protein